MKNLVMVRRTNDNRTRLYQVPVDQMLKPGDLVDVESAGGATERGVVSGLNRVVDDDAEQMLRDILHLRPDTEYKRVVSIYNRYDVPWDSEADDAAVEQEDA